MSIGADSLRHEVVEAMREAGLDAVGVTGVEPFEGTRLDLEQRRADGQHAGMAFTYRNPRRSTEPARLLRNAASIISGAYGYLEPTPPRPDGPAGRVARYAWRDHYADLRTGLEAGADVLRSHGHRAVVIADTNGLVDRAAAHRAGLGWWGRNTNLLLPGAGSWFVLGSVVTDADLPTTEEPVPDGCRSCTRCLDACPTGAIVDDGVIDARRCLAWLVQQSGVFPRAFRIALDDRLYGCDDCQDACPPGLRTARSADAAVAHGTEPEAWVMIADVLDASDDELLARFGRWYIPRREPRYLRRNALIVLGNVADSDDDNARRLVHRYLSHSDGMLRAHAVWTAGRLGMADDARRLCGDDTDPLVRAEVAMVDSIPRRCERTVTVPVSLAAHR